MSNPIQLNKQTIEAVNQGATKILLEIDLPSVAKERGYTNNDIYKITECAYQFSGYVDDDSYSLDCPLQIGQEYYMQDDREEIIEAVKHIDEILPTCNNECEKEHSQLKTWLNQLINYKKYYAIKFKVLNVEVKRVQDIINFEDIIKLGFPHLKVDEDGLLFYEWLEEFIDDMYGFETYESNPFVFIVEIKRIEK